MAILGKIRERSIFLIIVIGLALFAFVISGVFDGSSSNSGPDDPIAIINDEEVDFEFFRQLVDQTERSYNYSTIQALNLVWNQFLRNTIFDQEYEKLDSCPYAWALGHDRVLGTQFLNHPTITQFWLIDFSPNLNDKSSFFG